MADDWDLYAVVRSCKASVSTTTTTINTTSTEKNDTFGDNPFFINGLLHEKNHQFQELFANPAAVTTTYATTTTAATTSIPVTKALEKQLQLQPPKQVMQRVQNLEFKNINFPIATPQPIRPRKRKNQQSKTVRQMTQEELSNDSWAWRKYGQKPIKGSPYPRNYYRCSTTKGCPARKQVERSPTESNIYIVSCTGEHAHPRPTHRSSLAGSTRTKFPPPNKPSSTELTDIAAARNTKTSCSSSSQASASSFSPSINIQDNDEDMLIPNELMSEDIFKGFLEINASSGGVGGGAGGDDLLSPPWTRGEGGGGGGG